MPQIFNSHYSICFVPDPYLLLETGRIALMGYF